jgi:transposase
MFLKIVKRNCGDYLNLAENYRVNGKVVQKHIASLGKVDKKRKAEISRLVCKLNKIFELDEINDLSDLKEESRKNYGVNLVINELFKMYEMEGFIKSILKNKKIRYDFLETIKLMVMNRFVDPKSKLNLFENKNYYTNHEIDLNNLYRSLDILEENKDELEKHLFNMRKSLFNHKVDVVFYDVTTLAFESQTINKLLNLGYSKDKKFNESQIVLGMSIDKEGLPVSFNIFEGNKYEGHTLEKAIEDMKTKYSIDKVVIVADRGMLSENNLKLIEESGYEYIVGRSIKKITQDTKEEMFEESGYEKIVNENGEIKYKAKETIYKGNKLIIAYSEKRAKKDKKDRERLIEKAKKMIKNNSLKATTKRGAGKYLKSEVEVKELDLEKIKEDEIYDGYYGLITNTTNLSPKEIIEQYHELWKVEESFRTIKSFLETRPMYHSSEERISGHMVMCYLSHVMLKTLELKLKQKNINYSHEKIRDALKSLEYSEIKYGDEKFALRAKTEDMAKKILDVLEIKEPSSFMPLKTFNKKIEKA